MSSLVCRIEEIDNTTTNNTITTHNKTSKQVILSIVNVNETIASSQCDIQDLCEQLPSIMQKLMQSKEDKTDIKENGIDKIVLDFDTSKNLTTKRVLMSFLLGFFDNKIEVIEH